MGMYKLPAIVKGGITRWFPFHANGILRTDASNLLPENEWMREWMIILPGASCQKNTKPEPTSLPQRTVERTVTQVQTRHFALPPPPPPPHLAALAERLELGNDRGCSLSGIWDAWSISLSFWCLVLAMAFGPFAVCAELGFSNPFAPHCSVASWLRPSGGSTGPGEPLWEQGPGGVLSAPPGPPCLLRSALPNAGNSTSVDFPGSTSWVLRCFCFTQTNNNYPKIILFIVFFWFLCI